MSTRINKYLSEVGYCSRREADRLISEGKVTINGKIPEIGTKVEDSDQVEVKGQRIEKSKKQKNIYLAFTKPVGLSLIHISEPTRQPICCANNSYRFIKG